MKIEENQRVSDERTEQLDFGLAILGLYFTYHSLVSKVKRIAKFSWSLYPLLVFSQAIFAGFESTMAELVLEDSQSNPEQLDRKKTNVLEYVQNNIIQALSQRETYWNNFVSPFLAAIARRLEKISKLQLNHHEVSKEDLLVNGLFTGEDYRQTHSFKLSILFRAVDSRLRVIYAVNKSNLAKIAERVIGLVLATPSAAISTLLVNIDHLGRLIGGALAVCSKQYFGPPFSEKLASYAIPTLLILLLLWKEIVDLTLEYTTDFLGRGFFYPLFMGATVGLYEVISQEHPEILNQFQNRVPLIPAEVKNNQRNIKEVLQHCYEQTKRYYEKYDKHFVGPNGAERSGREIMSDSLTLNFNASKKILEGRRALFALCKKHGEIGEFVKSSLLFLRAHVTTLRNIVAKSFFVLAKNFTKPLYHFMPYVGDSVVKTPLQVGVTKTFSDEDESNDHTIADKALEMDPGSKPLV